MQRERLLQLEQEVENAHRSSPAKPGSSHSSGSISEEDFRRVMDVLSKRTQECDQLREVRLLAHSPGEHSIEH
jgi:hypothetical protein